MLDVFVVTLKGDEVVEDVGPAELRGVDQRKERGERGWLVQHIGGKEHRRAHPVRFGPVETPSGQPVNGVSGRVLFRQQQRHGLPVRAFDRDLQVRQRHAHQPHPASDLHRRGREPRRWS